MFDIQEQLKKLPDCPGCYLHKDSFGQIIYVGKAISLRRRVRQYFQSPENHTPKVRRMVQDIAEFEYITCGSEMEALVLECNLIKKYRPKYNILLRDDKTYPYIKVTLQEDYPRLVKTRRIVSDGAKYFGPYADAGAVNVILDLLNSAYGLKRCRADSFPPGFAPCLNYHIHQCRGVCRGDVDRAEYRASVEKAMDFLLGRDKQIQHQLREKMQQAAERMDYEAAAVFRDHMAAVDAIMEKQRVVLSHPEDIDIILLSQGLSGTHAVLFTVREGKLSGRESFFLGDADESRGELVAGFIKQYYSSGVIVPKEIMTDSLPQDAELLAEWLSEIRGSHVSLLVPARGEKRALLDLVRGDVVEMLKDLDEKEQRRREKAESIRLGLADVFGPELAAQIHRIEAYDISNINGVDSVGGMVVFVDGRPFKNGYRRFKIKTVDGANDGASRQEGLLRRLSGGEDLPDLILMDGGKPQVNAALAALAALGLDIPVAGAVKDDRHRTAALLYDGVETPLKGLPGLYSYVGAIQEEVHRFAIDYHHRLRGKGLSRSILDEIPGIGEKRKLSLLSHFGSVDAIRRASEEELAAAPGMNAAAAARVSEYFQQK